MELKPHQMVRLPKWALAHIERLEGRVKSLEALLDEQKNGSMSTDFGYTDVRTTNRDKVFLLPQYANLMAFPIDRKYAMRLHVERWAPRALQVMGIGASAVIVRPRSSNVVTIECVQ